MTPRASKRAKTTAMTAMKFQTAWTFFFYASNPQPKKIRAAKLAERLIIVAISLTSSSLSSVNLYVETMQKEADAVRGASIFKNL